MANFIKLISYGQFTISANKHYILRDGKVFFLDGRYGPEIISPPQQRPGRYQSETQGRTGINCNSSLCTR